MKRKIVRLLGFFLGIIIGTLDFVVLLPLFVTALVTNNKRLKDKWISMYAKLGSILCFRKVSESYILSFMD